MVLRMGYQHKNQSSLGSCTSLRRPSWLHVYGFDHNDFFLRRYLCLLFEMNRQNRNISKDVAGRGCYLRL